MAAKRSSSKTSRTAKSRSAASRTRSRTNKGRRKAAKKKSTKRKASKKKATKRKASKKNATKRKASKKNATKRKASKKNATKRKASKKKATKRKASKKKATKRKASKKKATKQRTTKRGRTSADEELDVTTIHAMGPFEVLEQLQLLTHVDDDARNWVPDLIDRLDHVATPEILPGMFGILASDDPLGIHWSLFFIMERFDDDYLEALIDALPSLQERAPDWAQTAVIRILNTRGEEDDCTESFERKAKQASEPNQKALVAVLEDMLQDPSGDLLPEQRDNIEETLTALGVEVDGSARDTQAEVQPE